MDCWSTIRGSGGCSGVSSIVMHGRVRPRPSRYLAATLVNATCDVMTSLCL